MKYNKSSETFYRKRVKSDLLGDVTSKLLSNSETMFSLRMFLSVMVMLTCWKTTASLSLSAEEDWYQCTPGISPSLGGKFSRISS